jgi:histidine triad (HIT) family protein
MEQECLFCQIIAGQRPADVVYEDEAVLAFKDVNPHAPVHVLIVPKTHIRSINDLTEEDGPIVAAMIMRARSLARALRVDRSGYKLQINVERGAGQVIFHLHMHLVGGWRQ